MQDLIKVDYNENTALARDIYMFIYEGQEKKQVFTHWFNRTVKKYGFEESKDFMPIWTESTGGRPSVDYVVSFEMGKELCMVAPTKNGKKARLYFIKCEQLAKEAYANSRAIRLLSKEVRKSLTDAVQESGEQERMHGHGYSTYTRMIYDILGLKDQYKEWKLYSDNNKKQGKNDYGPFRTYLCTADLKKVEIMESMIKPLLELDKQYSEIRDTLKPLFEKKEII